MEKTASYSYVEKSNVFKTALKSALLGLIISLVLVLVFAIVVKLTGLNSSMIGIVNQVIKILSVFFGVLFGVVDKKRWLFKGALGGALFAIISFLIFLFMGNQFNGVTLITDLAICVATGIVASLLSASKK